MAVACKVRAIASSAGENADSGSGARDLSSTFRYQIDRDEIILGRSANADIRLPDETVSHVHCRVSVHEQMLQIEDLGSTNGTWIAGSLIDPRRQYAVKPGVVVRIGLFEVVFVDHLVEQQTATTAEDTASFARQMVCQLLGMEKVSRMEHHPRLRVTDGLQTGTELTIVKLGVSHLIGRGEDCDLQLVDADASRHHAVVMRQNAHVVLHDNGSKNGTRVNGTRMTDARLGDGDTIQIGRTFLVFKDTVGRALQKLDRIDCSTGSAPSSEVSLGKKKKPVLSEEQRHGASREAREGASSRVEAHGELRSSEPEDLPSDVVRAFDAPLVEASDQHVAEHDKHAHPEAGPDMVVAIGGLALFVLALSAIAYFLV